MAGARIAPLSNVAQAMVFATDYPAQQDNFFTSMSKV